MSDKSIIVKNFKKYFGSIKAVNDISFEVEGGTVFGMLGPNSLSEPEILCMFLYIKEDGKKWNKFS